MLERRTALPAQNKKRIARNKNKVYIKRLSSIFKTFLCFVDLITAKHFSFFLFILFVIALLILEHSQNNSFSRRYLFPLAMATKTVAAWRAVE